AGIIESGGAPGGALITAVIQIFPGAASGNEAGDDRGGAPMILRHGCIEIAKDLAEIRVAGSINVPAVAIGAPAIHIDAAKNGFSIEDRGLIVAVDLGVNYLHPVCDVMRGRILRMVALPVVI